MMGDERGRVRDAADEEEEAESDESSEAVGASRVIFLDVREARSTATVAEKGGLRMPSSGVIINF